MAPKREYTHRSVWRELVSCGWRSKKPSGLSTLYKYYDGNCKEDKLREGENMFFGENALLIWAKRKKILTKQWTGLCELFLVLVDFLFKPIYPSFLPYLQLQKRQKSILKKKWNKKWMLLIYQTPEHPLQDDHFCHAKPLTHVESHMN
jgi:hypothetical protein